MTLAWKPGRGFTCLVPFCPRAITGRLGQPEPGGPLKRAYLVLAYGVT